MFQGGIGFAGLPFFCFHELWQSPELAGLKLWQFCRFSICEVFMSTKGSIYDDGRTHVYTDGMDPDFVFIDIDGHGGPDIGIKIPVAAWQRIRQHDVLGVEPDAFDRPYAPKDRIQVDCGEVGARLVGPPTAIQWWYPSTVVECQNTLPDERGES
jgi:hypothetical protein